MYLVMIFFLWLLSLLAKATFMYNYSNVLNVASYKIAEDQGFLDGTTMIGEPTFINYFPVISGYYSTGFGLGRLHSAYCDQHDIPNDHVKSRVLKHF